MKSDQKPVKGVEARLAANNPEALGEIGSERVREAFDRPHDRFCRRKPGAVGGFEQFVEGQLLGHGKLPVRRRRRRAP